jgi:uncharacterized membrane protein YfcA
MNKKLLIGILAGLGIVLMIFNPVVPGILALVFWIYLGVMVWKRKSIFHEKMEPKLAEKHLKRLKAMLILAVISFLVSIDGIIMHNVRSSFSGIEESLYFYIGFIALEIFILASAGGLVIFLKGRQKPI